MGRPEERKLNSKNNYLIADSHGGGPSNDSKSPQDNCFTFGINAEMSITKDLGENVSAQKDSQETVIMHTLSDNKCNSSAKKEPTKTRPSMKDVVARLSKPLQRG